jgi:hypothetical protein
LARWWVKILTAERENIRLATTAPQIHPTTWAGR